MLIHVAMRNEVAFELIPEGQKGARQTCGVAGDKALGQGLCTEAGFVLRVRYPGERVAVTIYCPVLLPTSITNLISIHQQQVLWPLGSRSCLGCVWVLPLQGGLSG
jgi:hypothetical protein